MLGGVVGKGALGCVGNWNWSIGNNRFNLKMCKKNVEFTQ